MNGLFFCRVGPRVRGSARSAAAARCVAGYRRLPACAGRTRPTPHLAFVRTAVSICRPTAVALQHRRGAGVGNPAGRRRSLRRPGSCGARLAILRSLCANAALEHRNNAQQCRRKNSRVSSEMLLRVVVAACRPDDSQLAGCNHQPCSQPWWPDCVALAAPGAGLPKVKASAVRGSSTVEPVVLRASRSSCALRTSLSA